MRLHFLNYHHNGDVHYSKGFMRDLYEILQPEKCFLHQTTSPILLKDIPFITPAKPLLRTDVPSITTPPPVDKNGASPWHYIDRNGGLPRDSFFYQNGMSGDDLYIVTWLGYYWICGVPVEVTGCSLYTNYRAFKKVYEQLGILDHLKPIEYYVPKTDFSFVEKVKIDDFCHRHPSSRVFISNGDVWSGQSDNFDFSPSIKKVAEEFPDTTFILSHATSVSMPSNVFYTSNIINVEGCDLLEISYLSCKCNVLVGRGSGPFCFCHIPENYNDSSKTMISFAHGKEDAFWYLPENGCKQVWHNQYDPDTVYNTLKQEVKSL